jgi:hypothetical protein
MKNKLLQIILLLLLLVCSSCESYIAFEKMRLKFLIYIFFGSLVLGLIIWAFKDKYE